MRMYLCVAYAHRVHVRSYMVRGLPWMPAGGSHMRARFGADQFNWTRGVKMGCVCTVFLLPATIE